MVVDSAGTLLGMETRNERWRWNLGWRTAVPLLLLLLFAFGLGTRAALARDWVGDRYSLIITDQTAVDIANWVLAENPHLPFRDPVIAIHPDGITGSGYVAIWDFRVPVSGKATVYVADGRVNGRIETLTVAGAAAPEFVLKAIGDIRSVYEATELTVEVTAVDLHEGELVLQGVYRQ